MEKPVVIIGASAHGRVIHDILLSNENQFKVLGFLDSIKNVGEGVNESTVIGKQDELVKLTEQYGRFSGIVAVGDNYLREKVVLEVLSQISDFEFVNAIHKTTVISKSVKLGAGNVFMPGVIINSEAEIGNHTIVNTKSSIEHNCTVEDYASVSAGVTTGGFVKIGRYSAIALGVTIFDRVSIGSNVVIGSGALVTKDLEDNVLAYGAPAKVMRARTTGERFLK